MDQGKVIVDIDGTISKVGDRLKFLEQTEKDWDSFYEACDEDKPITKIVRLVERLQKSGYGIIFCTGRRESVRDKTIKWIDKYFSKDFRYLTILMRKDGDFRHDTIVKPELIDSCGFLDYSYINFILEDRNSMCKKWRELGYTCLQVADGDF
jgi:hypothetical protein